MSYADDLSQANSANNAPMSFFRRLSAKLKAEKVQHRSRSSSNAEPCGAAVPYQDPASADDCDDDDDVIAGHQPVSRDINGGSSSSGDKVCVDGDNNEVFAVASADVIRSPLSCHCFDLSFPDSPGLLSAGIRSPGLLSSGICSPENEILSAAALLRRAQSVALSTNGCLSPCWRSISVSQGNGHTGLCHRGQAVFDIRREILGSLAESGDAERLRIALKSDNEAVNASDEVGLKNVYCGYCTVIIN